MRQEFYSNGKLLLSGEYAILDGAKGLAVPTKFGQSLQVSPTQGDSIHWKSIAVNAKAWFSGQFNPYDLKLIKSSDNDIANTLQKILVAARNSNPEFLNTPNGFEVVTKLDFPREWGLGTSSTLLNNIAMWAQVDAHELLWNSFGGSGYDISCAQHNSPLVYHIEKGVPKTELVTFNPAFTKSIFFVYLNQKQSSKKAIANYRTKQFNKQDLINSIDVLTSKMLSANKLSAFEASVQAHEELLSKILGLTPIKEQLFPDYFGTVKSLGGWGGDFVMVTGNKKTPEYFKSKGFDIVIPFTEMVL